METKANYILAGLFIVLSIIVAIFYSMLNTSWFNSQKEHSLDIYIKSSISGLNVGSQVLFNGIVVGKVVQLSFDEVDLNTVIAHCIINDNAPIRPSTIAELGYVGITGTAYINLHGGEAKEPLLFALAEKTQPYNIPKLYARNAGINKLMSLSSNTLEQVDVTLQHIDKLLVEFREPLKQSLNNIAIFSESLRKKRKDFENIADQSKATLYSMQKAANTINNMFSTSTKIGLKSLQDKLTESTKTFDRIEESAHNLSKNPQRVIWGHGRGDDVPIFGTGN